MEHPGNGYPQTQFEGPDRRPEGGLNASLKPDPKNPDTNTTPLLLKCANTTQHGQAASSRNTIGVSQNSCERKTREHTQSDSKTRTDQNDRVSRTKTKLNAQVKTNLTLAC